jgi:hypothetical protein
MIGTVLILAAIIVGISIIGLGVSIFFRKDGKFPETGVGHNPEMKKLGITCAKADEIKMYNLNQEISVAKSGNNNQNGGFTGCAGCNCS